MPDVSDFDGYILTGSEKGVYDEVSWMQPLRDFLVVARDVPVGDLRLRDPGEGDDGEADHRAQGEGAAAEERAEGVKAVGEREVGALAGDLEGVVKEAAAMAEEGVEED